jgi:guanosine-3',5'-bis(diphosphate) 3'-pyrophosphohydrolase
MPANEMIDDWTAASPFLDKVEGEKGRLDIALIRKAHAFAREAHQGQFRRSGEPYFVHCEAVADILLGLRLDSGTLAGGLLHDVLEDTEVGFGTLKKEFGPEVADLVGGVTKISGLKQADLKDQSAENYRKMLLAMTGDLRILLIKLADRLHNMRTLEHLEPEKQRRIAQETQTVYAPLAHRIGMAKIEWELEDLSFRFLEPEAYVRLAQEVQSGRTEYERYIQDFSGHLETRLRDEDIPAQVTGRLKHLASIHRKMITRGKSLEEIYDLMAFRVIVQEVRDCYHALGAVHSLFLPVVDRIKDYIATPKSNLYQALHTTVIGPGDRWVEIQIRTRKMDWVAEDGIAAHWEYKLDGPAGPRIVPDEREQVAYLKRTLAWVQDQLDPREFMDLLKVDLYRGEVFAFTPKGALKHLPRGATCLDFAFSLHSDIGMRTTGVKVNGNMVPLFHELQNGDVVEILTAKSHHPSRDWLKLVKTSKARTHLKQHFRALDRLRNIEQGRDLLAREARKVGLILPDPEELGKVARDLEFPMLEDLWAGLGAGDLTAARVLRRLLPKEVGAEKSKPLKMMDSGVQVDGLRRVWATFAKCCQPLPGENVAGTLSRSRGIVVHREDCPSLKQARAQVRVEWDGEYGRRYPVIVTLDARDRLGLLTEISRTISEMNLNLRKVDIDSRVGKAAGSFVLEVENLSGLERTLERLRKLPGVLRVERKQKRR